MSLARQGRNTPAKEISHFYRLPRGRPSLLAMRWPRVTGLTSYLSRHILFAVRRPPFLALPGSGGFAKFASFAHSASRTVPFRAPIASSGPSGEVVSPGTVETRRFVVVTVPRGGTTFHAGPKPSCASHSISSCFSTNGSRRRFTTNGRFSSSHCEAVRPASGKSVIHAPGGPLFEKQTTRGARSPAIPDHFIERLSMYLLQLPQIAYFS